eukprot:1202140-Rhodomonas_salina.2
MDMTAGREGMLEEDYFEPFIPHIRVSLRGQKGRLSQWCMVWVDGETQRFHRAHHGDVWAPSLHT